MSFKTKTVRERDSHTNVLSVGDKLYRLSKGRKAIIREFVVYAVHHSIWMGDEKGFVDRMVQYDIDGESISELITEVDEEEIGKTFFLSKAALIEYIAKQNGCNMKVVEEV